MKNSSYFYTIRSPELRFLGERLWFLNASFSSKIKVLLWNTSKLLSKTNNPPYIFNFFFGIDFYGKKNNQLSMTKGDISNIPWEGFKAFSSFLKSFSAIFWRGRKVLHASSHPLLWQLHLMSAKWSEKHPLVWVAGWWQGRGDAEIGAVKSCTHLLRQNSCPSGLYQAAWCMASKPNKTCRPVSHAPLLQTARLRFNWISQAVVAGGSSMNLSKSFMYLSWGHLSDLSNIQLTNLWGKKTNFKQL